MTTLHKKDKKASEFVASIRERCGQQVCWQHQAFIQNLTIKNNNYYLTSLKTNSQMSCCNPFESDCMAVIETIRRRLMTSGVEIINGV